MPIIILEGIDGSGKSTLATHLARQTTLQPTTIHRGPIRTTVTDELLQPLFDVEPDELLIADRWHISELIYGPIYRGESRIDATALEDIEATLKLLGAVRVILQPPLSIIYRRLVKRGEDFLAQEHVPLVYAAYTGFADMLDYHIEKYADEKTAASILARLP